MLTGNLPRGTAGGRALRQAGDHLCGNLVRCCERVAQSAFGAEQLAQHHQAGIGELRCRDRLMLSSIRRAGIGELRCRDRLMLSSVRRAGIGWLRFRLMLMLSSVRRARIGQLRCRLMLSRVRRARCARQFSRA